MLFLRKSVYPKDIITKKQKVAAKMGTPTKRLDERQELAAPGLLLPLLLGLSVCNCACLLIARAGSFRSRCIEALSAPGTFCIVKTL